MEEKRTTRICVPVCVQTLDELEPMMIRAAEVADIIELRLDCLNEAEFEGVVRDIANLCRGSLRPLILTFRSFEQGGRRKLDELDRRLFWLTVGARLLSASEVYVDIEIDIMDGLRHMEGHSRLPFMHRVICSYHDFAGVHTDLEEVYQRMIEANARILKIAIHANDITECIQVLGLLDRARSDGQEMIAIAMGNAGILTRILGPSRGGFLTFGSLDDDQLTAPGQIKATELRDLYRIRDINEDTEIMGLVGKHVMHSVSPQMHNDAFVASGRNAVYFPLEVRALDDFMRRMVNPHTRELNWNLRGLSITAPHKSAIIKHLDWIDPIAAEIGAVNTVVITGAGLCGYNTDASAVLAPLDGLIDLVGARVAVIGAGGAARSLLWSLRKAGARVIVFARDVESGSETAGQFDAECKTLTGAVFNDFEIVVNATPLGMRGISEDATPAITSQLRGVQIAYDLVYNPTETRFMREAREAGCQTIGGLQMLVAQAAEQFKLWTGSDAPIDIMRNAARVALLKS